MLVSGANIIGLISLSDLQKLPNAKAAIASNMMSKIAVGRSVPKDCPLANC